MAMYVFHKVPHGYIWGKVFQRCKGIMSFQRCKDTMRFRFYLQKDLNRWDGSPFSKYLLSSSRNILGSLSNNLMPRTFSKAITHPSNFFDSQGTVGCDSGSFADCCFPPITEGALIILSGTVTAPMKPVNRQYFCINLHKRAPTWDRERAIDGTLLFLDGHESRSHTGADEIGSIGAACVFKRSRITLYVNGC